VGVGIGCASDKPTKQKPFQFCSINSILSSVEAGTTIPPDVLSKPLSVSKADGIDLMYVFQNSSLCCQLRFTKITIDTAEVATRRLPNARIVRESSSAYIGAWFNYNNKTYEVISINRNERKCCCEVVREPGVTINLDLEVVNNLVDEFSS
jgi:hypothetical protein